MRIVTQQIAKCLNACLTHSAENNLLPTSYVQRRFRKPRHLGRAPTKDRDYFKKFHPTEKDLKEGRFLYDNYNLLLKSLVAGFQEELVLKDKNSAALEEDTWNEEAYHKMCMKHINTENERLKLLRIQRIEEELKLKDQKSEEEIKEEQIRFEEEKRARDIVLQTIEESEHWLTLENMEEKTIEAVDNPVNFNFAVSKKGVIVARTALVLPPNHEDYDELEKQAESG